MTLPIRMTRVLSRRRLGDGAAEIHLQRPPGFRFSPGQRLRVHCGDQERDYSIASAPDAPALMLCIRPVAGGRVSPQLAAVTTGAPVLVSGPYGHFGYQPSGYPAVFVATATGIAPFRSMIAAGGGDDILVLHGVRTARDRFYRELFERSAGGYVACISRQAGPEGAHRFIGRVTDYLARCLTPGRYTFYLCGRQDMIRDAIHIVDDRFDASHVFTEAFY